MEPIKKTKYKVSVTRVTEVTFEAPEKEQVWQTLKKEATGEVKYGWAEHPTEHKLQRANETLVMLEQELDQLDFPLVVRAINFPQDFNLKEGQGQ